MPDPQLAALPSQVRDKLMHDLAICRWIDANAAHATKAELFRLIAARCRHLRGYSIRTIERHYYAWLKADRQPQALLNQALRA